MVQWISLNLSPLPRTISKCSRSLTFGTCLTTLGVSLGEVLFADGDFLNTLGVTLEVTLEVVFFAGGDCFGTLGLTLGEVFFAGDCCFNTLGITLGEVFFAARTGFAFGVVGRGLFLI